MDILLELNIGIGEEFFSDEFEKQVLVKCIYYPMYQYNKKTNTNILHKVKIKGIGKHKNF